MFKAYERAAKAGDLEVGRMQVWETGTLDGPRFIINFPTKRLWRASARLADIDAGLVDLVRVIREHGIRSIALPPWDAVAVVWTGRSWRLTSGTR